jgi:tetratricopeptide (TPR) repeat protein
MALALGGASRERADAFLKKQEALIEDQRHHLREQFKQLRLNIWQQRMGVLLRIATAIVGLAAAAFISYIVWDAAHDEGLVIEALSVPPDLAQKGFTGQVVATQMLDDLFALQAQSNSVRALSTYSNNWGNDLKVEIPETGISLGEFNRYLHQLLGHQTHITGEVVHTADGLAITARAGVDGGERFAGPEANLDALVEQAAQAVYRRTQPYRYGVYLNTLGRITDAQAFFEENAASGPAVERAWANIGLTNAYLSGGRYLDDDQAARAAIRFEPNSAFGWTKVYGTAAFLGRFEAGLSAGRTAFRLLNSAKDLQPAAVLLQRQAALAATDDLLGDYASEIKNRMSVYPTVDLSDAPAQITRDILSYPGPTLVAAFTFPTNMAQTFVLDHDLDRAKRILAEAQGFRDALLDAVALRHDQRGPILSDTALLGFRYLDALVAQQAEDWPRILALAPALESEEAKLDAAFAGGNFYPPTELWAVVALARAKLGDFKGAHTLIDRTPGDCDLCLRMRGQINAAEKNYDGAAFWFAKLEEMEPSIPFADEDWGRMLLDNGQSDAAIEKFKLSNQRGPHFADPLEGWGEALMAKKQPDQALAKFEEAEKYASNWGRLHLKWGEALGYVGRKDEAQKQFALAAGLDMSSADKAELAKVRG